jgi:hypothetical protein
VSKENRQLVLPRTSCLVRYLTLTVSSQYVISDDRMVDGLEGIWKEAVMV